MEGKKLELANNTPSYARKGGRRKESEVRLLTKLVSDCITFNLRPEEALAYIKQESHSPDAPDGIELSYATYFTYRARLRGDKKTNTWLSYYTRIGFVTEHKELLDNIKKVQEDRLRQFFIETLRPVRNERVISLLNHDIIDNSRLISDLMDSTPIIASIRAKMLMNQGVDKDGRLNALISRVEIWKEQHKGSDGLGEHYQTTNSSQITVEEAKAREEDNQAKNVEPDETGVCRPASASREGTTSAEQEPSAMGSEQTREPERKRDLWTV